MDITATLERHGNDGAERVARHVIGHDGKVGEAERLLKKMA